MKARLLSKFSALLTVALTASTLYATSFSQKNYPTGNSPKAIASADLNRDGRPDLITADRNGFITVLLGATGGAFTISGNFSTTSAPVAVDVGDFNNDGWPDVAVLEDSDLEIFMNEQNGVVVKVSTMALSGFGKDLVTVDLNGDHIPDLAMISCTDPDHCNLQTFLNDGSGKLAIAQTMPLGSSGEVVAADFDRDSHDDLAVNSSSGVLILHSNNNGTVTLRQTLPSGFALAAGDVDAKNGADLVFSTVDPCFPNSCDVFEGTANVYLNDGTGHLALKATYKTGEDALIAFQLVDLTNDNRLDIVALSAAVQESNGVLNWAKYAGSGTFGTFSTIVQLGDPQGIVTRALNLDSTHDIAIADHGEPFTAPATVVLLNTGTDAKICTPPSSANLGAKICSPSSTPGTDKVTVTGAGNSPTGVRRVELWVDGSKKYNSPDDRLKDTITLSSGKHTLTVVAVDRFGATAKTSKTVTVP